MLFKYFLGINFEEREREKDHIHLSVTLSALRTWSFVCGVKYKKAKKHKWTMEIKVRNN